jgi:hypothetical protein
MRAPRCNGADTIEAAMGATEKKKPRPKLV